MTSQVQFKANGTLSTDDGAYVVRQFERETLDQLAASEWVTLLGPHKYGKSSALMRIRSQLKENGYSCAFIDLQSYTEPQPKYGQFLEWFVEKLASELGAEFGQPVKRRRGQLESWLPTVVTPEFPNVAVLIDEASGVHKSFRMSFFSQLRALYNKRGLADTPEAEVADRMVFAFAGTFRPNRMIDNHNSPFNVSVHTAPDDLTSDEVFELATLGLGDDAAHFAKLAFTETRGQPYYVQHLFQAVQNAGVDSAAAFNLALNELRAGAHGHLEDLTRYVEEDDALRELVPGIIDGSLVYQAGHPVHHYAIVTGIAREEEGRLVPRNPIYASALERFAEEFPH